MCGIFALFTNDSNQKTLSMVQKGLNLVRHRGPDAVGIRTFTSNDASAGRKLPDYSWTLGHVRLSIIDLSETGSQPMSTLDSRYWLVYNGEVYNYLELRRELQDLGWPFRGSSDTEVILTAYAQWGERALEKFNGAFAFVIIDIYNVSAPVGQDAREKIVGCPTES